MFFSNEQERIRYQRWYSDFVSAAGILETTVASAGVGAQTTAVAPQTADNVGVLKHEAGTTATGVSGWGWTNLAALRLDNGGKAKLEMSIRSGAALSDAVDTSTVRAGFLDSQAAEPTDGVYIRVESNSSPFIKFVARANGVETVVTTNITYTINTTYIIDIEVLGDASKAFLSINGVPAASITTNIPTGAGRETSVGAFLLKSLGVANKGEFYTDYCDVVVVFK